MKKFQFNGESPCWKHDRRSWSRDEYRRLHFPSSYMSLADVHIDLTQHLDIYIHKHYGRQHKSQVCSLVAYFIAKWRETRYDESSEFFGGHYDTFTSAVEAFEIEVLPYLRDHANLLLQEI